jgi:anti-sigma factor RsiW
VKDCAACAEKLKTFRAIRDAMGRARLKEAAPAHLRSRIEAALPLPSAQVIAPRAFFQPSRRAFFSGFAVGSVLSAALAASFVLAVVHNDQDQVIANEVVSAHIRSLQAGHLMDVETSDQHTVKPWFNGKLDVAPPVVDLTAQGFTLLGGRLDYIEGEPVASIVYQRRKHVINLFVAQRLGTRQSIAKAVTIQGYQVRHWTEEGLDFWAVSDLAADELDEFVQKISSDLRPTGPS